MVQRSKILNVRAETAPAFAAGTESRAAGTRLVYISKLPERAPSSDAAISISGTSSAAGINNRESLIPNPFPD